MTELKIWEISDSPASAHLFPSLTMKFVDKVQKQFMSMTIDAVERAVRADENVHLKDMRRQVYTSPRMEDDWEIVEEVFMTDLLVCRLLRSRDGLEYRVEARK